MSFRENQITWLLSDYVDMDTKVELLKLLTDDQETEDRFYRHLEFGTGGLRGKLGAGTNRINKYTVRRATQGLANYILRQCACSTECSVVIAYDTRHKSRELAEETAAVLNGNGIRVYLFDEPRPTPELSFTVRHFGAQAGIVITASHNPPQYNGYKVYWSDGGQIVPVLASEISSQIEAISDFSFVKQLDYASAISKGLLHIISTDLDGLYSKAAKRQMLNEAMVLEHGPELRIVYTPLHGTGLSLIKPLFDEVGFTSLVVVEEQAKPDPDFSTVRVPNPEEKDAFQMAIQLAETHDADLTLATDPDADRVGVVVRNEEGTHEVLSGNQTGALLLDYLLRIKQERGLLPANGTVVKTVVTSDLGKAIAQYYGVEMVETLTGFKYIGEKIRELKARGKEFLFGYEESFGYLAGTHARDKDAIVSSLLIAEMALYYKLHGQSLYQAMQGLYRRFGYYCEDLLSWTFDGKQGQARIADIMRGLRVDVPSTVGGIAVREIRDYLLKVNTDKSLPEENSLQLRLEDGSWVCARPSGTEPKIKFYISAVGHNQEDALQKLDKLRAAVERFVSNSAAAKRTRKVLVTGGAGFIGSHVVDKLVGTGDSVIVVDNLTTGRIENVNPGARFYLVDVAGPELARVFELEKPDYVIHLAAQVSVQRSLEEPLLDARTNVLGTINVLECCRKYGVQRIVYASSAAIYGDPDYLGVDEEHAVKAISPYGITKYTPELYLRAYSSVYGIEHVILRYANVYGPRQDALGEGGVVAIFTNRMVQGQAPAIYGDGQQTRDFVYVSDVAEATVRALEHGDGHAINISTGKQTSVTELFRCLNTVGGFGFHPVYKPERQGDIRHSYLANETANRVLHWHPEQSLEQGLRQTLRYYQDSLAAIKEVAVGKEDK